MKAVKSGRRLKIENFMIHRYTNIQIKNQIRKCCNSLSL